MQYKKVKLVFIRNRRLPIRRNSYILLNGDLIEQVKRLEGSDIIIYGGAGTSEEKIDRGGVISVVEPYLISDDEFKLGEQVCSYNPSLGYHDIDVFSSNFMDLYPEELAEVKKVVAEPHQITSISKDCAFVPLTIEDIHTILYTDNGVCKIADIDTSITHGVAPLLFTNGKTETDDFVSLAKFVQFNADNASLEVHVRQHVTHGLTINILTKTPSKFETIETRSQDLAITGELYRMLEVAMEYISEDKEISKLLPDTMPKSEVLSDIDGLTPDDIRRDIEKEKEREQRREKQYAELNESALKHLSELDPDTVIDDNWVNTQLDSGNEDYLMYLHRFGVYGLLNVNPEYCGKKLGEILETIKSAQ